MRMSAKQVLQLELRLVVLYQLEEPMLLVSLLLELVSVGASVLVLHQVLIFIDRIKIKI